MLEAIQAMMEDQERHQIEDANRKQRKMRNGKWKQKKQTNDRMRNVSMEVKKWRSVQSAIARNRRTAGTTVFYTKEQQKRRM